VYIIFYFVKEQSIHSALLTRNAQQVRMKQYIQMTIKSSTFAVSFWRINQPNSAFITWQWFRLAHIWSIFK